MNVKVGDFGLFALIETRNLDKSKTTFGTPDYIVSEILFDTANGYSFEDDTLVLLELSSLTHSGRWPSRHSKQKKVKNHKNR